MKVKGDLSVVNLSVSIVKHSKIISVDNPGI